MAAHALADGVVGHPEGRPGVTLLHSLPAQLAEALCSAPIGTHIVSFTHNVRFSVKGLTFHTHCWRKLTLPYLAEVQQIPTSPNCPNIEQTCLNLLKRLTNAPYVQPCIIHDVACTLKRKDKPFLMQR